MRFYITSTSLRTGIIEEVEGHLATGRTDLIHLTGVKKANEKVWAPNFHRSLDEAKLYLRDRAFREIQRNNEELRRIAKAQELLVSILETFKIEKPTKEV